MTISQNCVFCSRPRVGYLPISLYPWGSSKKQDTDFADMGDPRYPHYILFLSFIFFSPLTQGCHVCQKCLELGKSLEMSGKSGKSLELAYLSGKIWNLKKIVLIIV